MVAVAVGHKNIVDLRRQNKLLGILRILRDKRVDQDVGAPGGLDQHGRMSEPGNARSLQVQLPITGTLNSFSHRNCPSLDFQSTMTAIPLSAAGSMQENCAWNESRSVWRDRKISLARTLVFAYNPSRGGKYDSLETRLIARAPQLVDTVCHLILFSLFEEIQCAALFYAHVSGCSAYGWTIARRLFSKPSSVGTRGPACGHAMARDEPGL